VDQGASHLGIIPKDKFIKISSHYKSYDIELYET